MTALIVTEAELLELIELECFLFSEFAGPGWSHGFAIIGLTTEFSLLHISCRSLHRTKFRLYGAIHSSSLEVYAIRKGVRGFLAVC